LIYSTKHQSLREEKKKEKKKKQIKVKEEKGSPLFQQQRKILENQMGIWYRSPISSHNIPTAV